MPEVILIAGFAVFKAVRCARAAARAVTEMSVLRKALSMCAVQRDESAGGTATHQPRLPASEKWWLDGSVPAFPVDPAKVKIIKEPSEFYDTLLEKCSTAEHRITLASLYLGTGSLERKLDRLERTAGRLRLTVLLDHTRGSRDRPNSRHVLLPLLAQFQPCCRVCLYHTPLLRRPWRWLLPPRYNELLGLQHMKLYLFDDCVIFSGANLSHDYFTNRQDRYVVVEGSRPLADFYHGLVGRVCDFSLRLDAADRESLSPGWTLHPYRGSRRAFVAAAAAHVRQFYQGAARCSRELPAAPGAETWVLALVEMGQLGVHCDSVLTRRVLESAAHGSTVHLATGYFNLPGTYTEVILQRSLASYHVLMAHPSANGFLGARGPAGAVPTAYRLLAGAFLRAVVAAGQEARVCLWEYRRAGWTYHGKGLWYSRPGEHAPCLSLVGSSNMGARSVQRDLESQAGLVTADPELRARLADERDSLFARGTPFPPRCAGPKAPLWVSAVVRCFPHFF
ncbi:CDP-diacylglycerol--glycerol-3-phosphate 3-phosphatidyltransferase, mitochondrial isoform X2 [Bacillus rossius redtenbacheri]|uniref:CDP-diacylglycerol--glycerol-3-phosphate 3-phosphatidyltransferase, mitochondrial isoform X2 n=2 Tax=Bacillus rossius redtenbacheri TaxID=93214 RepID=UPI002FDE7FB0